MERTFPFVPNKHVACYAEDLKKIPDGVQVSRGMKTVLQLAVLCPLRVLFGNDDYKVGQRVWIEGSAAKLPFADGNHTYRLGPDETPFILVPEDRILLVTKDG